MKNVMKQRKHVKTDSDIESHNINSSHPYPPLSITSSVDSDTDTITSHNSNATPPQITSPHVKAVPPRWFLVAVSLASRFGAAFALSLVLFGVWAWYDQVARQMPKWREELDHNRILKQQQHHYETSLIKKKKHLGEQQRLIDNNVRPLLRELQFAKHDALWHNFTCHNNNFWTIGLEETTNGANNEKVANYNDLWQRLQNIYAKVILPYDEAKATEARGLQNGKSTPSPMLHVPYQIRQTHKTASPPSWGLFATSSIPNGTLIVNPNPHTADIDPKVLSATLRQQQEQQNHHNPTDRVVFHTGWEFKKFLVSVHQEEPALACWVLQCYDIVPTLPLVSRQNPLVGSFLVVDLNDMCLARRQESSSTKPDVTRTTTTGKANVAFSLTFEQNDPVYPNAVEQCINCDYAQQNIAAGEELVWNRGVFSFGAKGRKQFGM